MHEFREIIQKYNTDLKEFQSKLNDYEKRKEALLINPDFWSSVKTIGK